MASWLFKNTVYQIWLAVLKEGATHSSTALKDQRISAPGELPSPAAYLGSFSTASLQQLASVAACWPVLVRVMLSTETQQPKASRTHLDWGTIVLWKTRWECSEWNANRQEQLLGSTGVEGNSGAWTLSCLKQQGWSCFSHRQVSCFPFPSPAVVLTSGLIYSSEKGFN